MTKEEFFNLCATHDWFYDFSDDGGMFKDGHNQYRQMMQTLRENNDLIDIYMAWSDHMFNLKDKPVLESFQ